MTTPAALSCSQPRPPRPTPRARLVLLVVLGAFAALVLPVSAAQAANYQYWGYYQVVGGAWAFSQNGPDKTTPADGSVEGWRWAVDDGTGATPRPPRALPTFQAVCAATPVEAGKKRVAVVIDFGRPADGDGTTAPPAPVARCASVATAATGAEVLAAVATVRTGTTGLVCGLDGYPASGCGGEVATLSPAQKAPDTPVTIATATATATGGAGTATASPPAADATAAPAAPAAAAPAAASSGIPVGVWLGILVVLAGIVLLVWSARRRQNVG